MIIIGVRIAEEWTPSMFLLNKNFKTNKIMKIELNQEIIVVGVGNNARYSTPVLKGIVNKIGRKWFYVTTEDEYTGRDNKFSLEDGKSDGKGYMSEWMVYESEQARYEIVEVPKLRKEIINSLGGLSYQELTKILNLIKL